MAKQNSKSSAAPCAQSLAQTYKFEAAGLEVAMDYVGALKDELQARVADLSADEVMVLSCIKDKLNAGLPEELKRKADTVGGFVW